MRVVKKFINIDPVLALQSNAINFSKELFANYFNNILKKCGINNYINQNNVEVQIKYNELLLIKIHFKINDYNKILEELNRSSFMSWEDEWTIQFWDFKAWYNQQSKTFNFSFVIDESKLLFNLLACRASYYHANSYLNLDQFYGKWDHQKSWNKISNNLKYLIELIYDIRLNEFIMLHNTKKDTWKFELSEILFAHFNNNMAYKFLNKIDPLLLFESQIGWSKEEMISMVSHSINGYSYFNKLDTLAKNEAFLLKLNSYLKSLKAGLVPS